jgi:hypothetical protein
MSGRFNPAAEKMSTTSSDATADTRCRAGLFHALEGLQFDVVGGAVSVIAKVAFATLLNNAITT